MKTDFYKLLVHPQHKHPLKLNPDKNSLVSSESNELFEVVENVPILLPSKNEVKNTSLHAEQNSNFEYIDHYEKDAQFFDYAAEKTDKLVNVEQERLHEAILNEVSLQKLTLDVGCGKAWLAKKLCQDRNKNVISMDVSKTNPMRAIKNIPLDNHFAVVADVYNLPFESNTFDLIVASEIIEHVPDPKVFIDKLINVLKSKGKLVISTPYNEKIEYSLCVHCNKPTPRNAHIHSFSEKNIGEFLPSETSVKFKKQIKLMNNAILAKLRIQKIFAFLPFKIWKIIDSLTTKIIKRPARLILIIEKF